MMSLETIKDMNNKKAQEAARDGKRPYFVEEGEIIDVPFPFPNIGDYRPEGWELVETFFVDNSGLGANDELALTADKFLEKVLPGFGYAVIEAGQFQVYVGKFKKQPGKPGQLFQENNKRKELINQVEIGDLFYTAWGYDQTQNNFVLVTGISPTGKTAICKMARASDTGEMNPHYSMKPRKETFGESFRLKIEYHTCTDENDLEKTEKYLRGSYPFCHDADMSSKRLATFYECKEGATYYETGSGYGH